MLKILIKAKLTAFVNALGQVGGGKRKKKMKPALLVALLAFLALAILGSLGAMFWGYSDAYMSIGATWAIWTMAVLYAFIACLISSVFAVKSQIFESRDNELLMSMPIPHRHIFLSRMIILLAMNYLMEALVLVPCLVVYTIRIGLTFSGSMSFVAIFLLLPFIALAVSTFIAWIISEISSRVKHKTLVTVILFLLFFGVYIYFIMPTGNVVGVGTLSNTFIFWWGGDAIANADGLSLLYFALCSIIPALVAFVILDKAFVRIITTKRAGTKIEYKGNRAKTNGIRGALLKKELSRFFSSAAYVLNAGLGCIMTLVAAITLAVTSGNILPLVQIEGFEWVGSFIPVVIVALCGFTGSTSFVSAPSISLEDKQMWILHSCPIKSKSVLMAKLNAHMLICAPLTVIGAIILCIAYEVSVGMSIFVALSVFSTVAFVDYFGLFVGLKFPKFGWQNETNVIKQSLASLITTFGSMVLFIALGFLGYFAAQISAYLAVGIVFGVCVVLCLILHMYLIGFGTRIFENLKK